MRITRFIKKCTPVSLHGWFETDQGFNIRKPLGNVDIAGIGVKAHSTPPASENSGAGDVQGGSIPHPAQKSWWQRFKEWIKNLFS